MAPPRSPQTRHHTTFNHPPATSLPQAATHTAGFLVERTYAQCRATCNSMHPRLVGEGACFGSAPRSHTVVTAAALPTPVCTLLTTKLGTELVYDIGNVCARGGVKVWGLRAPVQGMKRGVCAAKSPAPPSASEAPRGSLAPCCPSPSVIIDTCACCGVLVRPRGAQCMGVAR